MHNCAECGRALTQDEIGATKKLINRAAEEYYCLPCLAKKFRVDERTLRGKIEYWRGIGCTLFPPKEEKNEVN